MLWYVLPAESVRAETFRDARKLGIKSSTDHTPSPRHGPTAKPSPQCSCARDIATSHFLFPQPEHKDAEHDNVKFLGEHHASMVWNSSDRSENSFQDRKSTRLNSSHTVI